MASDMPDPFSGLTSTLAELYAAQLRLTPDDPYLQTHARPDTRDTQIRVFRWYTPYLTSLPGWRDEPGPYVLDWGCRHAPDSCLLRATYGPHLQLCGVDFGPPDRFATFHQFAGLHYYALEHPFRTPYDDNSFSAVIGSGTLEHAAMDYESLKELWRILRPGGRLVITYLPNHLSVEEWWQRRSNGLPPHPRLYSLGELRHMLLHHGFRPVVIGYQTRYDVLGGAPPWKRWPVRLTQLHRFTSTLCAVAEKVPAMM
jgi:SAM-dependent methyltransferase